VEKLVALDTSPQDWAEQVRRIEAPALVISSDAGVIKPEHSVQLWRLLGGGPTQDFMGTSEDRLAIIPGASHIGVFFEGADVLIPMVTDFFAKE
jgi:hypothetical protein